MRSFLTLSLIMTLAPALGSAAPIDVDKRDDNARFTFYDVGLGACGRINQPSDFEWDNGAHCFQMITLTAGGKTTTAQIVDECPGCPVGGLNLSTGLFTFLAGSLNLGAITGSWFYDN
ncbi:hypothetical protein EWM64_g7785 [Hericium alpestre]|uniref:RlpA-like protein double-psi beta-barrel domain-containing protein n=1 Tax=Hericium alpestre TaxID=135208 RepID=A0A4Y9ZPN4_9AGAM|nr:hypothetical protein EWM64_g7785 [Hericium alpestre]